MPEDQKDRDMLALSRFGYQYEQTFQQPTRLLELHP